MSRAELEATIRDAFDGVSLGGGISLRQAEANDNWRRGVTDAEFRALPDHEVTDDWTAVDDDQLDLDNIAHLDAQGLRYYLPAFMIRLLNGDGDDWGTRTVGTIHALDQRDRHPPGFLELLTPVQRTAIARYVRAIPDLVELDSEATTVLSRAFRDVWSQYLAGDHSADL